MVRGVGSSEIGWLSMRVQVRVRVRVRVSIRVRVSVRVKHTIPSGLSSCRGIFHSGPESALGLRLGLGSGSGLGAA